MQTLQEQLQEKQSEFREKASIIMKSFMEEKERLVKAFLFSFEVDIQLEYEISNNDYNSILLICKEDKDFKIELKLRKDYDFQNDKYSYTPTVYSAGYTETSNFFPSNKIQISHMKDILYFTENFYFEVFEKIVFTKDSNLKSLNPLEREIFKLSKQIEVEKVQEQETRLKKLVSFKTDKSMSGGLYLKEGFIVKITDKKVFYKRNQNQTTPQIVWKDEFVRLVLDNPNYELTFKEGE